MTDHPNKPVVDGEDALVPLACPACGYRLNKVKTACGRCEWSLDMAATKDSSGINLCSGCSTMKHLNAAGYCGRCEAPREKVI